MTDEELNGRTCPWCGLALVRRVEGGWWTGLHGTRVIIYECPEHAERHYRFERRMRSRLWLPVIRVEEVETRREA
jgi:hypothetical protein